MSKNAVAVWHELVKARNAAGIADLLAEDVTFYSPVVHTPQQGKDITNLYLVSAFSVFFNDSFRYVRELHGERDAVLEFELEIDGIQVNGVDMMSWNDDNKITSFKVMLRPLKAVNLIHQHMGAMLEKLKNKSTS